MLTVPTGAPVKLKKHQADSEGETEKSETDEETTKKKKRSKKKARLEEAEPQGATDNVEELQPPARRKRGRPRKPVEEKASKAVAVSESQLFNASVFVSVENPPQLMHGKTHKTDKHVAQEPRVEGPFTLIRSMKWTNFLDEVAVVLGSSVPRLEKNRDRTETRPRGTANY